MQAKEDHTSLNTLVCMEISQKFDLGIYEESGGHERIDFAIVQLQDRLMMIQGRLGSYLQIRQVFQAIGLTLGQIPALKNRHKPPKQDQGPKQVHQASQGQARRLCRFLARHGRTSQVRQCIFVLAHFPSAPVHSGLFSVFLPNFVRPYLLHTDSNFRKLGLYFAYFSETNAMAQPVSLDSDFRIKFCLDLRYNRLLKIRAVTFDVVWLCGSDTINDNLFYF